MPQLCRRTAEPEEGYGPGYLPRANRSDDGNIGYEPAAKSDRRWDNNFPPRLIATPLQAGSAQQPFNSCNTTSPASGTNVLCPMGVYRRPARAGLIVSSVGSPGKYHQMCGRTIMLLSIWNSIATSSRVLQPTHSPPPPEGHPAIPPSRTSSPTCRRSTTSPRFITKDSQLTIQNPCQDPGDPNPAPDKNNHMSQQFPSTSYN